MSTQVSSGNIVSKISGPERDTKEVIVLTGVVLFIGGLLAAAWLYSQSSDQTRTTTNTIQSAKVSEVLKNATVTNQAQVSTSPATYSAVPRAEWVSDMRIDLFACGWK